MSRSIGGAKRGTLSESPLPLIDPHGGDSPSTQHPILHPKPLHPGSGSEIEIEHSDNDNGEVTSDNDTTDSNEVQKNVLIGILNILVRIKFLNLFIYMSK